MPFAIVDLDILWKLVVASLAGGFGLTLVFSVVIYGATRFVDLRRGGSPLLAGLFGLITVVALLVVFTAMVLSVLILADKG